MQNSRIKIEKAELFALDIPFKMDFTHARAKRLASDSLVLKISDSGKCGYGEAVIREYVSGRIDESNPTAPSLAASAEIIRKLLAPIAQEGLTLKDLERYVVSTEVKHNELPLLCAIETALIDLFCCKEESDIYDILSLPPVHTSVFYGGIIPLLPAEAGRQMLLLAKNLKLPNLKLKVGVDPSYNEAILKAARETLGDSFDLRVDVNGSWTMADALTNLKTLCRFNVKTIEEPFSGKESISDLRTKAEAADFIFIADESVLTIEDLRSISKNKTYDMINIRLSKNGGIFRSLAIASEAEKLGIAYQLGCLVGETGILSAVGRVAASLMQSPRYVEGSYDRYLLSDNVVAEDISFGSNGHAPVLRNNQTGVRIKENKLAELSSEKLNCL